MVKWTQSEAWMKMCGTGNSPCLTSRWMEWDWLCRLMGLARVIKLGLMDWSLIICTFWGETVHSTSRTRSHLSTMWNKNAKSLTCSVILQLSFGSHSNRSGLNYSLSMSQQKISGITSTAVAWKAFLHASRERMLWPGLRTSRCHNLCTWFQDMSGVCSCSWMQR